MQNTATSLTRLAYFQNEDKFSVYHMFVNGEVLVHVLVTNIPMGANGQAIIVATPDRTKQIATAGRAPIVDHAGIDGTGVHVDGAAVQAYVYTRLPFILAALYGPERVIEFI